MSEKYISFIITLYKPISLKIYEGKNTDKPFQIMHDRKSFFTEHATYRAQPYGPTETDNSPQTDGRRLKYKRIRQRERHLLISEYIHNFTNSCYFCTDKPSITIKRNMKKYVSDLLVAGVEHPREDYVLLRLTQPDGPLPEMVPGQFVEVLVEGSAQTFLRRPISINYVDYEKNELWLLVHVVGAGTAALSALHTGDILNCLFPLGNGFSMAEGQGKRMLLVGGGVGTAPLLYYGRCLKEAGHTPIFLLGGRSSGDLMQLDLFREHGPVHITTEDGSLGEKGFVTNHSVLGETFDAVATCGPKPMMMAVARFATSKGLSCEASLENMMACGLGACLCCVEKDKEGHNVCVCKEGPVFNINQLQWQTSK